ncbi:hypothetical protein LX36DRAFT_15211 [Colletotrichum falcatum]|nr:hypothetical protein LX36DRAFT_15211 [Colletotrichum falcatum]
MGGEVGTQGMRVGVGNATRTTDTSYIFGWLSGGGCYVRVGIQSYVLGSSYSVLLTLLLCMLSNIHEASTELLPEVHSCQTQQKLTNRGSTGRSTDTLQTREGERERERKRRGARVSCRRGDGAGVARWAVGVCYVDRWIRAGWGSGVVGTDFLARGAG